MNRRSLLGSLAGALLAPFTVGKKSKGQKAESVGQGIDLCLVQVRYANLDGKNGYWKPYEWAALGEVECSRLSLLRKLSIRFPRRLWYYVCPFGPATCYRGKPCNRGPVLDRHLCYGEIVIGFDKQMSKDQMQFSMVRIANLCYMRFFDGRFRFVTEDGLAYFYPFGENDVQRVDEIRIAYA